MVHNNTGSFFKPILHVHFYYYYFKDLQSNQMLEKFWQKMLVMINLDVVSAI